MRSVRLLSVRPLAVAAAAVRRYMVLLLGLLLPGYLCGCMPAAAQEAANSSGSTAAEAIACRKADRHRVAIDPPPYTLLHGEERFLECAIR